LLYQLSYISDGQYFNKHRTTQACASNKRFLRCVVFRHSHHFIARTDEHSNALMQGMRLNIQDARFAIRGRPTRLLDDECHGAKLKAQLSGWASCFSAAWFGA